MFRSIKIRLTVTICGILLFVFSIQMAGNFLFAEDYYVYQKMQMMKDVYHQIRHQAELTDESLEDIIRGLNVDRNLEFIVADRNMKVIFNNKELLFKVIPRIKADFDFKKYPIVYFKESKPTLLKTDMIDGDRIRLLSKIERGDETYYLAIRLSVQAIGKEMRSTNIFIFYLSSFAMIAGGFFVYAISKRLAKPIEAVNKVAIDVSNLDFSSRAEETGRKDEIGSLAANINNMADRLERNISSLQEANRKLEEDNEYMNKVDEQRKEFIANISHELKTPLAILSGYAEMLDQDVPGIDKSFYYETILDETHKMDILLKNLLSLSNMENALASLTMEEIDIPKLTERIYRKNEVLMKNKGILGEYSARPCKRIRGDMLYLEEAINNYLSNAISYTEKGHRLKLIVEPIEDEVVVRVYNEGKYIEEAHLDKIWNSFYREDKSRTRTSQNNIGLGLYIVRTIMNALHGKCGVTNKDNGVEFWLSLKEVDERDEREEGKMQKEKSINDIKLFVLDMDGTFYLGNQIFDFSLEFLKKVREAGKEFIFFTNNSSKAPKDYIEKLARMNCMIQQKDIMTSGDVTIEYLKTQCPDHSVYLLGTKELEKNFLEAGIRLVESDPDIVIVGFDTTLTYEKLEKACTFIRKGSRFIATHIDVNCPTEDGFIPDCGAICAAIRLSTGVEPEFMGKPYKTTVDMILSRTGYQKNEIAFVGDRLYTDVATGVKNGSTGILVLTGETKQSDVETSEIKPDFIFTSLREIGEALDRK